MGYQDLGVQDKIRPRGYTNSLYNITQSSDSEDLRLNYKIMLRGCANRLYNIPNSSDSDAEETHEQSLQHPQQRSDSQKYDELPLGAFHLVGRRVDQVVGMFFSKRSSAPLRRHCAPP